MDGNGSLWYHSYHGDSLDLVMFTHGQVILCSSGPRLRHQTPPRIGIAFFVNLDVKPLQQWLYRKFWRTSYHVSMLHTGADEEKLVLKRRYRLLRENRVFGLKCRFVRYC
jgi:hypothetical protein